MQFSQQSLILLFHVLVLCFAVKGSFSTFIRSLSNEQVLTCPLQSLNFSILFDYDSVNIHFQHFVELKKQFLHVASFHYKRNTLNSS